MQGMSRWIVRFVVCLVAVVGVLRVTAEPKENASIERVTRSNTEKAPVSDVVFKRNSTDVIVSFPIPEGTKHVRLDTIQGAGSVAGATGTLIYSSMLGKVIAQVPRLQLIADDIVVNAAPGCALRSDPVLPGYTFQTIGIANPEDIGGEYSITYALFDDCPGLGGSIIPGTSGQVTIPVEMESDIVTLPVLVDEGIILPCNIWLGLRTSRDNVGLIMGAPATVGFSEDILDFPGFACNAAIGGFPSFGHATFNVEIFGDASCSPAFLGFKNEKAFKGGFSMGANILLADDIELGADGCEMVAYEVGVRGPALYTFDLRRDIGGIPGSVIAGTRIPFVLNESNFHSQCFAFSSPITLEKNFFVTFKAGNDVGGWINTGSSGSWGHTTESFFIRTGGEWVPADLPHRDIPDFGGFYFKVLCAGDQPVGACCDMYLRDAEGEAICRDLPEMNCAFPPRGLTLRPAWKPGVSCRVCSHGINEDLPCSDIEDCMGMFCDNDGTVCTTNENCMNDGVCVVATCEDNDPFVITCGHAACCKPSGATGDGCEDLTRNQCNAIDPVEGARQWQLGTICNVGNQLCPRPECLARKGDCAGEENVICIGGPLDGETCDFDDCECRGCCDFSNRTCVGGANDSDPCLSNNDCLNGSCRGICFGGISDPTLRCISHEACQFDGCMDGNCFHDGPGPGVCNGGDRHGKTCNSDRDCECTTCECSPGCEKPICCTKVCDGHDPFCCNECWDATCSRQAEILCPDLQAENDECKPTSTIKGARLIKFGESVEINVKTASASPDDPGICCNTGPRRRCIEGGANADEICDTVEDCLCLESVGDSICCDVECCDADPNCDVPARDGLCSARQDSPGAQAMNTVWFRFEVPERTSDQDPEFVNVRLSTCNSNAPATDSILQVFSIPTSDIGVCRELGRCSDGFACNPISQDCKDGSFCSSTAEQCSVSAQDCPLGNDCVINMNLACDNLSIVGCNDDAETSCSGQVFNSDLCLPDLKRGQSYIVLLGVKEPEAIGTYRLTVNAASSCDTTSMEANMHCDQSTAVTEGVYPFDLNQSTFSCPKELGCNNTMQNDVWFTYIPDRSGQATIKTCGPDAASTPNTQIIVYDDCVCPPPPTPTCILIGPGNCLLGASGTIDVNAGQCYLIRVGDRGEGESGNLTISLELPDCNQNGIIDDCEIDCGPAKGVCEDVVGCGTGKDCDLNGTLDICEGVTCCPVGEMIWLDPPLDTVDARYPFDPFNDTFAPLGISTIQVQGPPGADVSCWSFCETAGSGIDNSIVNFTEVDGLYTIQLDHPITLEACTTLTYTDESATKTRTKLIAHPANADGLALADAADVTEIINILNGSAPAFGMYSADIDHTGFVGPGDLLAVIDLLNGAIPLTNKWMGTLLPDCANCPQ